MARRFCLAWVAGAVPGVVVFWWMVTAGTFSLFRWQKGADFFDAQAHSWLDGRWDVPPEVAGLEGIVRDDSTYLYFGPLPAALRVPVTAFTDRFDGRLTAVSLLLAVIVATAAAGWIAWQVREALRGRAALGRGETVLVATVAFVVAGGSTLLYLASRTLVYHEAALWGVALTLLTLALTLNYWTDPRPWRLTLIALAATGAVCSRFSIGVGAISVLWLLALGTLAAAASAATHSGTPGLGRRLLAGLARLAPPRPHRWRDAAGILAAAVVPVVVVGLVNWIRFRTLFSIPLTDQVQSLVDPERQEFLAENGSFFGLQFLPTTIVQYLRPTGVSLDGFFPFLDFADPGSPTVGNAQFDLIDRNAGLPASVPLLFLLALTGVLVLIRRPHSQVGSLRVITLAAAFGALPIFVFGYIAHRYTADVFPLLLVAGLIGMQGGIAYLVGRPAWRPALAGFALLAGVTIWTNFSLGLVYQRLWSPDLPETVIADFVDFRLQVDDLLGGVADPTVIRSNDYPEDGETGDFLVIRNCDGLYIHGGLQPNHFEPLPWRPVELTERTGDLHFALTMPADLEEAQPILVVGAEEGAGVLTLEPVGDDGARFSYYDPFGAAASATVARLPGETRELELLVDRERKSLIVRLDGEAVLETLLATAAGDVVVGVDPFGLEGVAPSFEGLLMPLDGPSAELCRELVAEAD